METALHIDLRICCLETGNHPSRVAVKNYCASLTNHAEDQSEIGVLPGRKLGIPEPLHFALTVWWSNSPSLWAELGVMELWANLSSTCLDMPKASVESSPVGCCYQGRRLDKLGSGLDGPHLMTNQVFTTCFLAEATGAGASLWSAPLQSASLALLNSSGDNAAGFCFSPIMSGRNSESKLPRWII